MRPTLEQIVERLAAAPERARQVGLEHREETGGGALEQVAATLGVLEWHVECAVRDLQAYLTRESVREAMKEEEAA